MKNHKFLIITGAIFLVVVVIGIMIANGFLKPATPPQEEKNSTTTSSTTSAPQKNIAMKNFSFDPSVLTIKVRTTVTWTNNDSAPHDVISEGNFNSGTFRKGETFSYTFDKMGTFDYFCSLHSGMDGQIIVTEE